MSLLPGVRERIYMGVWLLDKSPGSLQIKKDYARQEQRFADGTLFQSWAQTYQYCPQRITKHTFTLNFETLSSDDLERIRQLVSIAGDFDFCPFLPFAESWWNVASGTAQRRDCLTVITDPALLPADAAAKFAAYTRIGIGGSTGVVTWGAVDDQNWRQPWTSTGTPEAQDVTLVYWPVFRVAASEDSLQVTNAQREIWTLTLKEI